MIIKDSEVGIQGKKNQIFTVCTPNVHSMHFLRNLGYFDLRYLGLDYFGQGAYENLRKTSIIIG